MLTRYWPMRTWKKAINPPLSNNCSGTRKAGGRSPSRIKKLATLLNELDRRPEAVTALDGLLYIAPGDEELHSRLGRMVAR